MSTYEWNRYWRLRGITSNTSDNGFLYDPESEYGPVINPNHMPLAAFTSAPCLVLLGQPGSGKSTESRLGLTIVDQDSESASLVKHFVDLKEYQTDMRLVADAFENDTVREWLSGSHILQLSFDSLDEGRLEVRNIASVLSGQFRRLKQHASRLRLRIACRTLEWPRELEESLMEVWDASNVQVIELAPLRKCDICVAAKSEQIDADDFIAAIIRRRAQPFASFPLGLKFLLEIFRHTGDLPSTEYELYEKGCLYLCNELSPSRRASGHAGSLTAAQRLEIAGRIAAAAVFCGQSTITLHATFGIKPEDGIQIHDLVGGNELIEPDQFEASDLAIRESLSTMLFSGRGAEVIEFAHRTYAEFLAARYVLRRKLDDVQVHALIFHPDRENRIVPQLSETAAWIATKHSSTFARMLSGDPQALLRSDVATGDNSTKHSLVATLLAGFQQGELDDSEWGMRKHYAKLAHVGLADQLEPVLRNATLPLTSRRFALALAEECRDVRLLPLLKDVALDEAEDPHIRAQSCYAIVGFGSDDDVSDVRKLGFGNGGLDPQDDLRGIVLEALWMRRLVSANDLFASIPRAKRRTYFGAYRKFLLTTLGHSLRSEDLVEGLQWCTRVIPEHHTADDFERTVAAIVAQSLSHLALPGIRSALAELAITCFNGHVGLPVTDAELSAVANVDRQSLVVEVLSRLHDVRQEGWGLVGRRPLLVPEDDFEWLLEQSQMATSQDERRKWAELARLRFGISSQSMLNAVLTSAANNPEVAGAFADLILPIDLDSPTAVQQRTSYHKCLELEAHYARSEPLLDPPPHIRVEDCLKRCEEGDLFAWSQLNRELQLEARDQTYRLDLEFDLTKLPGWNKANDETKARILLVAQQYLLQWQTRPRSWRGTNILACLDFSGYRAFTLVYRLNHDFLDHLADERWENWGCVVLSVPISHGMDDEVESCQKRLVAQAFKHAPNSIIRTLKAIINRDAKDKNTSHLSVLARIELVNSPLVNKALVEQLRDMALPPWAIANLFEELMKRDSPQAESLARLYVRKSLFLHRTKQPTVSHRPRQIRTTTPKAIRRHVAEHRSLPTGRSRLKKRVLRNPIKWWREVSRKVASVLWLSGSRWWEFLSPLFHNDRKYFRDVITDVAFERRQLFTPPAKLDEEELADIYILLSQEFPSEAKEEQDEASFLGPLESVLLYKDRVLANLQHLGTFASYSAIQRIGTALPELEFISWVARAALKMALQSTWRPISVRAFRELAEAPTKRMVRNERELQIVVGESLLRLQHRFHGETPAVRDIWDRLDKSKWQPIDENDFSDYIKRHLELDLKGCGIVALREVEIRRGHGQPGERTDIYVTATVSEVPMNTLQQVRVILEAKGCWHKEILTAMESQLKNRYLKDNDCQHGIYLVGWFVCDAWTPDDHRKKDTPKMTIDDARTCFQNQAGTLSDESTAMKAIVMDCALI